MRLRFQFTHPGRGATLKSYQDIGNKDVSIHAPREGCDGTIELRRNDTSVSIHAPREGCDRPWPHTTCTTRCFNSRTPGGVRLYPDNTFDSSDLFQFTHPGRGATPKA